MRRSLFFLPLGALIAFAAYLGLQFGKLPSETQIINRYAAEYMRIAPAGAKPTDCAATSHPNAGVRMVINCVHDSGVTTSFFVNARGSVVPQPQGPST